MDNRNIVSDFITFESETSVIYPFGILPEEITEEDLDDIVEACQDITDTDAVYDACISVLGTNPDSV